MYNPKLQSHCVYHKWTKTKTWFCMTSASDARSLSMASLICCLQTSSQCLTVSLSSF